MLQLVCSIDSFFFILGAGQLFDTPFFCIAISLFANG